MTIHKSYREESRRDYGCSVEPNAAITLDEVKIGAILRIADAAEKMAQRYSELLSSKEYWEGRARTVEIALNTERRRVAALRGYLKRIKKPR